MGSDGELGLYEKGGVSGRTNNLLVIYTPLQKCLYLGDAPSKMNKYCFFLNERSLSGDEPIFLLGKQNCLMTKKFRYFVQSLKSK
jgi:hypothetical protein